jgi:phosphate transport system permease protein
MSAAIERTPGTPGLTGTAQQRRRQQRSRVFRVILIAATGLAIAALAVLLATVLTRGWDYLSLDLIRNMPSRKPERAGLESALFGTIWVIGITALIAFPIGTGAGLYLEEYGPRNRLTTILQTNISNLAGVPSVVYGLLGLGIFVQLMGLGRTLIAGALTMSLLILPVIIISTQEALRAVPPSLREAAYGVGATKWQVTWHHVLPAAMPGILTGTILSVSRAIGETAPLLIAGGSGYIAFRPDGLFSNYTALPIQIYNWTARPQEEFRQLAAAGIVVLLVVLLVMNSVAIVLRQRLSRNQRG